MVNQVLSFSNVSIYYGEHCVLREVNLSVKSPGMTAIIGPNGGGKSTILKATLGLLPIHNGHISLLGEKPSKSCSLVGYCPQEQKHDRSFPASVWEITLSGRYGLHRGFSYTAEDQKATRNALELTGVWHLRDRAFSSCSGGERQKALIARALCIHPQLLVLDEPFNAIDEQSQNELYRLFSQLAQKIAIVIVSHDTAAVAAICQDVYYVAGGNVRLVEDITEFCAHGASHKETQIGHI